MTVIHYVLSLDCYCPCINALRILLLELILNYLLIMIFIINLLIIFSNYWLIVNVHKEVRNVVTTIQSPKWHFKIDNERHVTVIIWATWTRASSSLAKSPDVSPATSFSSSFLNTAERNQKIWTHHYITILI